MVTLIQAATRLEAWMRGTEYLLAHDSALNLVLAIAFPTHGPNDDAATKRIDEFLTAEAQIPTHSVAETIFPGSEYQRRGLRGVFETYPQQVYPSIKNHPSCTYATDCFIGSVATASRSTPLIKQMIEKMRSELATPRPKKSCYELGIAEGEYDLPVCSPARDAKCRMGFPCLSHLSFKLFDGAVHLTALYRSHDYGYKVPGNLLGLARLQSCVATETGQRIGSLVIHSSYALLSGSRTPLADTPEQPPPHRRAERGVRCHGSLTIAKKPRIRISFRATGITWPFWRPVSSAKRAACWRS